MMVIKLVKGWPASRKTLQPCFLGAYSFIFDRVHKQRRCI